MDFSNRACHFNDCVCRLYDLDDKSTTLTRQRSERECASVADNVEIKMDENMAMAIELFKRIQDDFPNLTMRLDMKPINVDMGLEIPEQNGLLVPVNLSLQSDELHMNAGSFCLEWFPCQEEFIQKTFLGAVRGFLSGRFRILEHCRGNRVVKAELQEPKGDGWKTIGTWSTVHMPWPFRRTTRTIQNAQPSSACDVATRAAHES